MSDIDFGTPYSFLGNIWILKNELKEMSSGQRIISDNNPSVEFYINSYPEPISDDGITRITESRSSFEDVWEQITRSSYFLSKAKKNTFKETWDSRLNIEYASNSFNLGGHSVDPEESIIHYRKAISYDASDLLSHVNLATKLNQIGKHKEAISHYQMAIKLKPDFVLGHYNLGITLLRVRMHKEAIYHLRTAINIKPDFALAHYSLGVALGKERKNSEAIFHYKMAIEHKPELAKAHNNLGVALLREKKYAEAISHYKMAVEQKSDYYQAHNNLGYALFREKKYEESIYHFRKAIKLKPDLAIAQKILKKL